MDDAICVAKSPRAEVLLGPHCYAFAALAKTLVACPFCREMFEPGEVSACPECGLKPVAIASLPPSHDALADAPEGVSPDEDRLAFTAFGRGRGALAALAIVGVAAFFAPWAIETAPELAVHSGADLALRLPWMWAACVAFFVMLPLVLSRRTIRAMRGARVAVAFLAAFVLVTVSVRWLTPPTGSRLHPARVTWSWGLYASGGIALAALALASRFGGRSKERAPIGTRAGRASDPGTATRAKSKLSRTLH